MDLGLAVSVCSWLRFYRNGVQIKAQITFLGVSIITIKTNGTINGENAQMRLYLSVFSFMNTQMTFIIGAKYVLTN